MKRTWSDARVCFYFQLSVDLIFKKNLKLDLKDFKIFTYKTFLLKEAAWPPLNLNFWNVINHYEVMLLVNLNFKS